MEYSLIGELWSAGEHHEFILDIITDGGLYH